MPAEKDFKHRNIPFSDYKDTTFLRLCQVFFAARANFSFYLTDIYLKNNGIHVLRNARRTQHGQAQGLSEAISQRPTGDRFFHEGGC